MNELRFGPRIHDTGDVTFRLWAPACVALEVQLDGERTLPMQRTANGFFELRTTAGPGTRYRFRMPDGSLRPDPASRFQPEGIEGPSEVVAFPEEARQQSAWRGVPKKDLVIYEIHVGTFTPEGTYAAASAQLERVVELGITAIELMPLAQSSGRWNWGYDGVYFYAPFHGYGTPADLRRFIDRAHALGLAVILDVVYNHYGAEGNYLREFGGYVSEQHTTPWGDAPNFDGEDSAVLRQFVLENVAFWIEAYGFDGIRLDAAHCIADDSRIHIVKEIGETCQRLQETRRREIHLIAESNIYDPELLIPLEDGGYGFDGLWCDDFLHSVHAILNPDRHLSDRDYLAGHDLDLILRRGYVFHGTLQSERERHLLETYPERVGMESLVAAIQTHDFIGNHPSGLRFHQIASPDGQRAAAALLLLLPSIPMLFMGEEFLCPSPFLFFVDFSNPDLRRAVEAGRKSEHPQHDWSESVSPLDVKAFEQSKLPSTEVEPETFTWYRSLIETRKAWAENGLLTSITMVGHWDQERSLAWVCYDSETGDRAFVLVRLQPAGAVLTPVEIRTEGNVLLSQNCQALESDPTQLLMHASSVLVGTGSVAILDA